MISFEIKQEHNVLKKWTEQEMAIARLSVKVGKAGKAKAHAEYIDRDSEKKQKKDSVSDLENCGSGNMPIWAQADPKILWESADLYERKNGSTYREYEIALPRELNKEQRHDLVKDFIEKEIGTKYPYQYAIHNPKAMDGFDQPHVHLMLNERLQDGIQRDPEQYFKRYNSKNPDRGGARKDNTGKHYHERKEEIQALRQRWEEICNQHLEKNGIDTRIDMRSYFDQGIDKEAEKKLLPSQAKDPAIREALQGLRAANQAVEILKQEIAKEPLDISSKQQRTAPDQAKDIYKIPDADILAKMDIKTRVNSFKSQAYEIAQHVEAKEIRKIKEKLSQLSARIHVHDTKEPLFFKGKWKNERETLVQEYRASQKDLERPFERYLEHVEKILKEQGAWKTYSMNDDLGKVEHMERIERFEKHAETLKEKNIEKIPSTQAKATGSDGIEILQIHKNARTSTSRAADLVSALSTINKNDFETTIKIAAGTSSEKEIIVKGENLILDKKQFLTEELKQIDAIAEDKGLNLIDQVAAEKTSSQEMEKDDYRGMEM